MMSLTDEEYRVRLRAVVERSGLSLRGLSAALGRDPGFVAASLDPSRPSRARPTPADLLRASDAIGISFVELLETLWGIDRARVADELARLGLGGSLDEQLGVLTETERTTVVDYIAFLAGRRASQRLDRTSRRSAHRRPALARRSAGPSVDPDRPPAGPDATPPSSGGTSSVSPWQGVPRGASTTPPARDDEHHPAIASEPTGSG